jgi:hypothetical protein
VCASCLAKAAKVAADGARPNRGLARVRRVLTLAAAVVMLWVLFYAVGSLLLSVPPDLHEGTVWQRIGME